MGNQITLEEKELEQIHAISLSDLEKVAEERKKKKQTNRDRYIWYKFLCQKPTATNILYNQNLIVTKCQEESQSSPCEFRLCNYLYDFVWREDIKEEAFFWLSRNQYFLWFHLAYTPSSLPNSSKKEAYFKASGSTLIER